MAHGNRVRSNGLADAGLGQQNSFSGFSWVSCFSWLTTLVTFLAFLPALGFPFLNWDDQDVFVRNDVLRARVVLPWAFTTNYMEHYQPLAWVTWAAVDRTAGLTPATAHGLNIVLHALCGALMCLVAWRVATSQRPGTEDQGRHRRNAALVAAVSALLWTLHPLRVEPVVWASAMPYPLALVFGLLATLAWLEARAWSAAILVLLSLLSRPLALALPVILWIIRRPATTRERSALLFAAACAVVTATAESYARLTASFAEFGLGARLTLAATAPWRYLWRSVWPVDLTPLDPLALTPRTDLLAIVLGLGGIALVSAAAWRARRKLPVLAAAWAAYLLLLAPAMGVVPSGLQATADRYTYLPAVPLSIAIAFLIERAFEKGVVPVRSLFQLFAVATLATLAALTWRQTHYWRDSTTLWTRAAAVDPQNDVALYNLGAALGDAGRRDEAIARYEQVLAIVPGHRAARVNRDLLEASRLEEEGNGLASRRDLDAAIARYVEALELDPRRTHAQAALGMALTELGRHAEALPHLRTALDQGVEDPAVPNALAYALAQSGDEAAAVTVLRAARQRYPGDADIARNLARLDRK
jgi:Flp pilus assembly protein TadD